MKHVLEGHLALQARASWHERRQESALNGGVHWMNNSLRFRLMTAKVIQKRQRGSPALGSWHASCFRCNLGRDPREVQRRRAMLALSRCLALSVCIGVVRVRVGIATRRRAARVGQQGLATSASLATKHTHRNLGSLERSQVWLSVPSRVGPSDAYFTVATLEKALDQLDVYARHENEQGGLLVQPWLARQTPQRSDRAAGPWHGHQSHSGGGADGWDGEDLASWAGPWAWQPLKLSCRG